MAASAFDYIASRQRENPAEMLYIPGGIFRMDRTPVTNRAFRDFVMATGYVTFAQKAPDPKDYPGAKPEMLRAGSLVFTPPNKPVDLRNIANWWRFTFGADWRHPYGPKSSIGGLDDHPVVHAPIATP